MVQALNFKLDDDSKIHNGVSIELFCVVCGELFFCHRTSFNVKPRKVLRPIHTQIWLTKACRTVVGRFFFLHFYAILSGENNWQMNWRFTRQIWMLFCYGGQKSSQCRLTYCFYMLILCSFVSFAHRHPGPKLELPTWKFEACCSKLVVSNTFEYIWDLTEKRKLKLCRGAAKCMFYFWLMLLHRLNGGAICCSLPFAGEHRNTALDSLRQFSTMLFSAVSFLKRSSVSRAEHKSQKSINCGLNAISCKGRANRAHRRSRIRIILPFGLFTICKKKDAQLKWTLNFSIFFYFGGRLRIDLPAPDSWWQHS